jgi:stage III sporulation protein AB
MGAYFGWKLKERRSRLSAVCLFIGELSDRIRTGADIEKIVFNIGGSAGIFYENLSLCYESYALSEDDKKLLSEFLDGIGLGDTDSQIERCRVYKDIFASREREAEKQSKEKAGLYGKLGIFSGLFIAVMLV